MFPDVTLPDSVQALVLIILFFMPGFVAGKVFELSFPRGELTEKVRLLEYVTLSCVNYAIWSWTIILILRGQYWKSHPGVFLFEVLIILLISPAFLGFGMTIATERQWFQKMARRCGVRAPHYLRTAWEWFFRNHPTSRWWVIIRLRSGIMVYGFFGWNSYMGDEPGRRDLYLEKECKLDEKGNLQIIRDTGGIYVRYADIEAIAFRSVKERSTSDSGGE